ncbi:hypothetical protein D3C71_2061340 [compost metagenome]
MVAYDRSGSNITKMAGRGRITANEIDQTLGDQLCKLNMVLDACKKVNFTSVQIIRNAS